MAQKSPRKPRVLWRGELLLPDGTALPGLAIVSTTEPVFASQSPSRNRPLLDNIDDCAGSFFTLSKEHQDELSLAIEMVRHAPLQVLDVHESLTLDDQGRLSLTNDVVSKGGKVSSTRTTSTSSTSTSYEAAGDVRLFVDPAEQSTVAFFERTFAYDALGARFSDSQDVDEQRANVVDVVSSLARSAMTFSFDKVPTQDDAVDPFSMACSLWSSSHYPSSRRTYGDVAMEAAIIGVVRRTERGAFDCVELHVGRKITRRLPRPLSNISQTNIAPPPPLTMSTATFGRSTSTSSVRPDDPAPRTASKFVLPPLKKLPTATSSISSSKLSTTPSQLRRTSSEQTSGHEASSSSRSTVDPLTSSKKRGGAHTPGRRGEKRWKKSSSEAIRTDDTAKHTALSSTAAATGTVKLESAEQHSREPNSLEEQNRSLIKKLVHYQLLGRGVERHEESYVACFGFTCQGALLAFRKTAKLELIDKQAAAAIVERHLDMYL